jgi:hypothetical protein
MNEETEAANLKRELLPQPLGPATMTLQPERTCQQQQQQQQEQEQQQQQSPEAIFNVKSSSNTSPFGVVRGT